MLSRERTLVARNNNNNETRVENIGFSGSQTNDKLVDNNRRGEISPGCICCLMERDTRREREQCERRRRRRLIKPETLKALPFLTRIFDRIGRLANLA